MKKKIAHTLLKLITTVLVAGGLSVLLDIFNVHQLGLQEVMWFVAAAMVVPTPTRWPESACYALLAPLQVLGVCASLFFLAYLIEPSGFLKFITKHPHNVVSVAISVGAVLSICISQAKRVLTWPMYAPSKRVKSC